MTVPGGIRSGLMKRSEERVDKGEKLGKREQDRVRYLTTFRLRFH